MQQSDNNVSYVPGQLGKRGELKKALLYFIIFWIKGKLVYSYEMQRYSTEGILPQVVSGFSMITFQH